MTPTLGLLIITLLALVIVIIFACNIISSLTTERDKLRAREASVQKLADQASQALESAAMQIAKFDHDGNGKPGGSLRRR